MNMESSVNIFAFADTSQTTGRTCQRTVITQDPSVSCSTSNKYTVVAERVPGQTSNNEM